MGISGVAFLLCGLMVIAHGKLCNLGRRNTCPPAGSTSINFGSCGLVDTDLADVISCIDDVGRSGISSLDLSLNDLTNLPADMFTGMAALTSVYLTRNRLVTLPVGLFAGLTLVENLSLSSNQLAELDRDIFADLTSMLELFLYGNKLTVLPDGIFSSSTSLNELHLDDNELTSLPEGLFAGMTTLELLYLYDNKLTTLPEGIFSSLTSLTTLEMYNNELAYLPEGLFEGMTALEGLFMSDNKLTTLPKDIFSSLASLRTLDVDSTVQCVPENPVESNPAGAICECTLPNNVLCGAGMVCAPGVNDVSPGFTCGVDPDAGTGGDPHMIGLSGQTIDWNGEDGCWYALLSDIQADVMMSVRLTAPLPADFPSRQLMTGFAMNYEGGHSVVIEIKDPYTTKADGCPEERHAPCLSDGALRLTIDGEEQLAVPVENAPLKGTAALTASNLPPECRPYGSDVIWADTFANMANGRLLASGQTLDEWVLGWSVTTAAPAWCEKFLEEFGAEGLLDYQNKHTAFRIETPHLTVRLHSGTNHQGGELLEDGRILPQLEFWQMDVHIEHFDLNTDVVTGILGETARPVLDGADQPIMSGPNALRGEVEDYRISGALVSDFRGFHEHQ